MGLCVSGLVLVGKLPGKAASAVVRLLGCVDCRGAVILGSCVGGRVTRSLNFGAIRDLSGGVGGLIGGNVLREVKQKAFETGTFLFKGNS